MSDIKMFRTATGEDIIAEYVGEEIQDSFINRVYVFTNAVQLVIIPPKAGQQHSSYGFAPFPQYAKPKNELNLYFTKDQIVFFIDIEKEFLDQYLQIFGGVITPEEKKLILN